MRAFRYRARSRFARLALIARAVSGGQYAMFASGAPDITMTTTAAVTVGRLVEISGDRSIRHALANSTKVLGVAKQTGSAVGDKVGVSTGGVWLLRADGAIAAGDKLVVSAAGDGRVAPLAAAGAAYVQAEANASRAVVGTALAAIATGTDGPVLLQIG